MAPLGSAIVPLGDFPFSCRIDDVICDCKYQIICTTLTTRIVVAALRPRIRLSSWPILEAKCYRSTGQAKCVIDHCEEQILEPVERQDDHDCEGDPCRRRLPGSEREDYEPRQDVPLNRISSVYCPSFAKIVADDTVRTGFGRGRNKSRAYRHRLARLFLMLGLGVEMLLARLRQSDEARSGAHLLVETMGSNATWSSHGSSSQGSAFRSLPLLPLGAPVRQQQPRHRRARVRSRQPHRCRSLAKAAESDRLRL